MPKNPKPMKSPQKQPESPEFSRDKARQESGPQYGGKPWDVAEERGDKRFGPPRNDDANPSELDPGEADFAADDMRATGDPDLMAAEAESLVESSGQHEGFGRGEKPRKPKSRDK